MPRHLFAGVLAVAALLCAPAAAQRPASEYVPLDFEAAADDQVGRRLAHQVRELLAASMVFRRQTLDADAHMQVSLVTMDAAKEPDAGVSTVYSVTYSWKRPDQPAPYLLTHFVGTCGMSRVQTCAENIVANASNVHARRLK